MLATSISPHNTQQQDDTTLGNVCHGLYHRPWPSDVRSSTMRQFTTSWVTPGTLSLFYFTLNGVLCHFFYQCILKQNFANQGRCSPRHTPSPVAVCHPVRRNLLACHIMVNAGHARFALFCTGGCLGHRNATHGEIIEGGVGPRP
jgi:hypothetical protein